MPQPVSTAAANHPGGGVGVCDIPIGIPVAIPVGAPIEECAVNGGARVETLVRCPRQIHQAAVPRQSAPPAGLSDADGRRMVSLEKIRTDLRRTARGGDGKGLAAGDGTACANSTKLRVDMERCVRGAEGRQEDEVQLTEESIDTRERAAAVPAASRAGDGGMEGEVAGQTATLGATGGAVVVSPRTRGGRIVDRRGVSLTTMTAWQASQLKEEMSSLAELSQIGEEGPKERIGCKDEWPQVQAGARPGILTEAALREQRETGPPLGACRVNSGGGTSCTELGGSSSVVGHSAGKCGKRDRAQALLSLSPDKAGKGAYPWGV